MYDESDPKLDKESEIQTLWQSHWKRLKLGS